MRSSLLSLLFLLFSLTLPACSDDDGWSNSHDGGLTADAGVDSAAQDGGTLQTHKQKVEALVKPIVDGAWTVGLVVGLVSAAGQELYFFGKLNDYAGTYQAGAGGVVIQLTSGALHLVVTGQGSFRMYPTRDDTFYLRVSQTGLAFSRDSAGKVTAMELSNSSGKTTFTKQP